MYWVRQSTEVKLWCFSALALLLSAVSYIHAGAQYGHCNVSFSANSFPFHPPQSTNKLNFEICRAHYVLVYVIPACLYGKTARAAQKNGCRSTGKRLMTVMCLKMWVVTYSLLLLACS